MSHEMEPLHVSHPLLVTESPSTFVFCFYVCPKDSEGRSVNSSTNTAVCASRPGLCSVQTPCDVMRSPEASPATCFSAAGVRAWGIGDCIIVIRKGRPLQDTGGGQKRRGGVAGRTRAYASARTALLHICLFSQVHEIWVVDMMTGVTSG